MKVKKRILSDFTHHLAVPAIIMYVVVAFFGGSNHGVQIQSTSKHYARVANQFRQNRRFSIGRTSRLVADLW